MRPSHASVISQTLRVETPFEHHLHEPQNKGLFAAPVSRKDIAGKPPSRV